MCGRFSLFTPGDALARRFGLVDVPVYAPRYNIAPTSDVVVVRPGSGARHGSESGRVRSGVWMGWGVKTPGREGALVINARSETASERPMFREAFRFRRCLVPTDGFFEWRDTPTGKEPYWFSRKESGPFAMAGLWIPQVSEEGNRDRGSGGGGVEGEVVILTTDSNPLVARVHDRMPVILEPGDESKWLDPGASRDQLEALLRPHPEDRMVSRRVSKTVNDVTREGAGLIQPDEQQRLF